MKKIGILAVGVLVLHSFGVNSKYNKIQDKLDIAIENSHNPRSVFLMKKIDSLNMEIMNYGAKLDSMRLKYDYAWAFTN